MNPYYKAFDRKNHKLIPSKEEYEAYVHPTIIDKKTGQMRDREVREMTVKQLTYHNYIFGYWIRNVQPYLCEVE
jgi:hypothetical protein